ncbi:PH domain-containing protein [Clostridium sp. 1001271B_151109_B4]|uniref:PH domain-containing protein n=1 Tax=Clostridium sp. 1001271B_151109_B4 TaxID=2787148 RepID=UPI0018AC2C9C|nr:PH domain-containing protein [Clostridium sp. 1001271B_151109_B4]
MEDQTNNKRVFNFYGEVEIPKSVLSFVSRNENPLFAVKTVRDAALFTDKKILICDKQGITGKKTEYYAIPYSKIVTYAIETAGHFDMDSEIKLFLTGGIEIEMNFLRGKNMDQLLKKVFNVINEYVTL